jgi:histone acetyltransferase (RNA polymerase elongator complex component)
MERYHYRKKHINMSQTNQKSKIKNQKSDKPLIIPVFIPGIGCPHQCIFCNQPLITEKQAVLPDSSEIGSIIRHYLQFKGQRKTVELAFFGGNFLGLPADTVLSLLNIISPYVQQNIIHSIRFSTRPDNITQQTLSLLNSCSDSAPVSTIEIGVQSMNDAVLKTARRGHTSRDTINAIDMLKKTSMKIGVQLMVGLPGDNEESLIEGTKQIAALSPDFARIYPLLVFHGTPLATWYREGRYSPPDLSEAVHMVKKMVKIFNFYGVEIIRMGLQASDTMADPSMNMAGPWHPAFGHLVRSEIFYDMLCEKLDQYPHCQAIVKLQIYPGTVSVLMGDRKINMQKLKLRYPDYIFQICTDESVPAHDFYLTMNIP